MQSIDTTLFLWLTGSPHSPGWSILLATFCASVIVPLVAAALALVWVRARPCWRPVLLDAAAAASLGLGTVQVIGWIHYRPRPFDVGLGSNMLHHLPENSFPSDHATLMFALAFGLLATAPSRRAGAGLLALAFAVSWARVFLGVHYPSDVLGGALLGLLCLAVVRSMPRLALWNFLDRCYERLIAALNLPRGTFPRRM